jgi:hypothetical protein
MMKRTVLAAALFVAACSSTTPPLTGVFDGEYKGSDKVIVAGNPACSPGTRDLRIERGQVQLSDQLGPYTGTVAQDGSIAGRPIMAQAATVQGQTDGSRVVGVVSTANCKWEFALTRVN